MTTSNLAAIILAAGKGTRMRSNRAKVLHELGGEPMIARAVRAVAALNPHPIVIVVGHQAAEVETAINLPRVRFALQEPQRGTGHAARCGLDQLPANFNGDVLITYGDMPAIKSSTLRAFVDAHRKRAAKLSFISIILDDPSAYGRVIRDAAGNVEKIVEFRDASPAERAVKAINTGCYLVDSALLRSALAELKPSNA
ncbi:MAG TPA: NTP transferase domain-containing protein, partial [Candidatus Binatus sp.]|nr:NTP transferase domain-containing protein [Candidatus Binatus sp.]